MHFCGLCYSAAVELADLTEVVPYVQQLTFGGLAGFAAGYALKKLGKLAAIALGLFFISMQVLAYHGFVTIHWDDLQRRVNPFFEGESVNQLWRTLVEVLTYNVTFAAAFVPGLIVGIKRG